MRSYSIAICGSGIGGLAAAIALNARGHDVTVYEKVPSPMPIGSGLMLQPTGQAALAGLGLLDQTLALGRKLSGIEGKTAQGRTIFDIDYRALDCGAFGVGIHRGALFHVLDAERSRRAIPVVTDTEIVASRIDGSKRILTSAISDDIGAFDLVVDGTGLHSRLRRTSGLVTLDRAYPYGAIWGVVNEPLDWRAKERLTQRYDGAKVMVGLLPLGTLPSSPRRLTALFWSLKTNDYQKWRDSPLGAWQRDVIAIWPEADPFVSQFTSHADLTMASYADVWMKSPVADRLAFIGDAARAASPQLGQGANLALVDATVLARCLTEHATIAEALQSFASARRTHSRFYGLASRWLTPFFQSDSRIAATLRDRAFAPMTKIPLLRREMVRTLSGIKTGIFHHAPPATLAGVSATEITTSKDRNSVSAPAAD